MTYFGDFRAFHSMFDCTPRLMLMGAGGNFAFSNVETYFGKMYIHTLLIVNFKQAVGANSWCVSNKTAKNQ